MNFNKLKKLLPKKSVLNKNKWLILAIVLCVCVGLYWYSKKNKENFEKYAAGYTYLTTDNNVELNRALYNNVQVMEISELKNPNADADDLITYLRDIRKIYVNGLKAGCTLNPRYKDDYDGEVFVDVTKGAINTSDFNDFFLGEKSDSPGAWLLGDEDMFQGELNCDGYNKEFKDKVGDSGEKYNEAKRELERKNNESAVFSETDYFTNAMNETVTVFVAEGCVASDKFLTEIWTQQLKEDLLEKHPTVSLNVEKCEVLKEGTDGRKKEDPMCKLSGLFSTDDKESTLAYPLIQYSNLYQTKNLEEGKYALIKNNFDPTKKYDSTENARTFEELDPNTGNSKIKYSATKIKAWLLDATQGALGYSDEEGDGDDVVG